MKAYKPTGKDGHTLGDLRWGKGVTHELSLPGPKWDSEWPHAYRDLALGVFVAPKDEYTCVWWEAEAGGDVRVGPSLADCTRLTTLRVVGTPTLTSTHYARFAIGVAALLCQDGEWRRWARAHLRGYPNELDGAWRSLLYAQSSAAERLCAAEKAIAAAGGICTAEVEIRLGGARAARAAASAAYKSWLRLGPAADIARMAAMSAWYVEAAAENVGRTVNLASVARWAVSTNATLPKGFQGT